VGQELDIALSYSASSPECRLDVVVPVLVVVKHMARAKLWVQACMNGDYSPDGAESQE
jgi:hypothetical protein